MGKWDIDTAAKASRVSAMLTVFNVGAALLPFIGLFLGLVVPAEHIVLWMVAGFVVGAIAGTWLTRRVKWARRSIEDSQRLFASATTDALRAQLQNPDDGVPKNLILTELRSRGEDMSGYAGLILDWLESKEYKWRLTGFCALDAYPELRERFQDYGHVIRSAEQCRLKVAEYKAKKDRADEPPAPAPRTP